MASGERGELAALESLIQDRQRENGIVPDAKKEKRCRYDKIIERFGRPDPPDVVAKREREEREREERKEQFKRRDSWNRFSQRRGRRYEDVTLENFQIEHSAQQEVVKLLRKYSSEMTERLANGNGLLLFGSAGCGKDHMLTALVKIAVFHHGATVEWRDGQTLYGELRDSMNGNQNERDILRELVWPKLLVLSDPLPPSGTLTEYQASSLFRIIDGRYSNRRATWISMNVKNRTEAVERLGAQIVDRLTDDSLVLPCNWPSYRKPL